MKIAVLLVLFAAMGGSAFAQGFRFDATVTQQGTIAGVTNAVLIPANPQIAFCNFPANATPCTNKATTYTSQTLVTPCSTSTQIVLVGTSSCVASVDAQDNWGVWVPAGMYSYTVTLPGGVNLGPYAVALFPPSANYAFTGTNTHSGTETFTGPVTGRNVNETLYVGTGAGQYSTCAAAIAAAGTVQRVFIEIDPSYTGAACSNTVTPNIILRSIIQNGGVGNQQLYCNPASGFLNTCQAINFGFTDGNVYAVERHESIFNSANTSGAVLGLYALSHIQNFTASGNQTIDGFSGEANTWGTLTGTLSILSGHEADATVHSTGGTISNIYGIQGYANSAVGSTTAVTNVFGVKGIGCNSILGAAPANCYGLFGNFQNAGSSRNYAAGFDGVTIHLYNAALGFGGQDFEDISHVPHHVFYNDSSNNLILQATSAASGLLLEDSAAANHLRIKSTGVDIFTSIHPTSAGGAILGTTALPIGTYQFGTAATNNWAVTPVALAAAHTLSYPDPGTQTTLTPGLSYNSTIGYYVSKRATAGCTTAASIGGICATPITVTWGPTLPNTNYSVVCTPNGAPTALPSNPYTITKTATTVTVNYYANSAVAASWPTVDCMAILD